MKVVLPDPKKPVIKSTFTIIFTPWFYYISKEKKV